MNSQVLIHGSIQMLGIFRLWNVDMLEMYNFQMHTRKVSHTDRQLTTEYCVLVARNHMPWKSNQGMVSR